MLDKQNHVYLMLENHNNNNINCGKNKTAQQQHQRDCVVTFMWISWHKINREKKIVTAVTNFCVSICQQAFLLPSSSSAQNVDWWVVGIFYPDFSCKQIQHVVDVGGVDKVLFSLWTLTLTLDGSGRGKRFTCFGSISCLNSTRSTWCTWCTWLT